MSTFREYLVEANKFYLQNRKTLRKGECYSAILAEFNPDLADSIHGTSIDPFWFDHRLEKFLNYLQDNWYGKLKSENREPSRTNR